MTQEKMEVREIPLSKLKVHPRNMRRVYDQKGLQELAASIKSRDILQALKVAPADEKGVYWVVAGNRRLLASRMAGKTTAPCNVYEASMAEQMLDMAIENGQREDPDPISEAKHYQALIAEGTSEAEIIKHTGISSMRIRSRIALLSLDEEIQAHVASGRLSKSPEVVKALLSVRDKGLRLQMAERFAQDSATAKAVIETCERVAAQLTATKLEAPAKKRGRPTATPPAVSVQGAKPSKAPMVALAEQRQSAAAPQNGTVNIDDLRASACAMCKACEVRTQKLKSRMAEPGWVLVTEAAGDVCKSCDVREIAGACSACPGVEMLRKLIGSTRVIRALVAGGANGKA